MSAYYLFKKYDIMHLKFTYHANYRREERSITVEEIKQVIRSPDIIERKEDGKLLYIKRLRGKPISVVFSISRNIYIIITIF